MEFKDLEYLDSHEWVRIEGDVAYIGVSDYAQHEMGDVVFVELPEVGDAVKADTDFANVESVKAVFDIKSPVTGEIVEVNEELNDSPEKINEDPFGSWIAKVKFTAKSKKLMNVAKYKKLCEK